MKKELTYLRVYAQNLAELLPDRFRFEDTPTGCWTLIETNGEHQWRVLEYDAHYAEVGAFLLPLLMEFNIWANDIADAYGGELPEQMFHAVVTEVWYQRRHKLNTGFVRKEGKYV